jgi:hypothetical protein
MTYYPINHIYLQKPNVRVVIFTQIFLRAHLRFGDEYKYLDIRCAVNRRKRPVCGYLAPNLLSPANSNHFAFKDTAAFRSEAICVCKMRPARMNCKPQRVVV